MSVALLSGYSIQQAVLLSWVGSTRLAENSVAYLRNVLCRPDTCRSLMRERWFVVGPGRSATGQKETFIHRQKKRRPTNERRPPHVMSKTSVYWIFCTHTNAPETNKRNNGRALLIDHSFDQAIRIFCIRIRHIPSYP